ncbi:thiamine pyrophosphate-dependent dehydrogenase E1 component subunit alpha [Candidatus Chloroploca asiatica]|uniref:2-oxoisovalerate dehydrogenase subunit alpha n=1 Tax=Candidatus Chloroploca asiatica TaxID=1506545 RepID=A0A2H3KL35_9CHLR|nr:thiamine pyrophosphate-dependent dehydrogenase E1 component subunit alpha [Candidatus Chloroploca asiatica]PDV98699.1 2-oxoisovalerate dehydrogenase [Candidatus Chloroploca asiatica]
MTVSIADLVPGASESGGDLSAATLREMFRFMLLARVLDERMWLLNRAGKAPFVISCQGHEAAQVGAAFALTRGKDFTLPYYRGLATVLVMGMTPTEVMLGLFARATDPSSGGRQMPAHYSHRRLKIITQSSPVGTQIAHAAGVGLAERIKGGDAVVWTSFGEGTTSQGDFHEGINLAAVQQLPVIFQCENNEYAISVPQKQQMAVTSVADRGPAYGIPGISVDGTDVLSVYEVTRRAVERARRGDGSTLIEARVVRLTAHSSDDNDRTYRSQRELKSMRLSDPLARFAAYLHDQDMVSEAEERDLRADVAAEVDAATEAAEQAPMPDPETLHNHVYAL